MSKSVFVEGNDILVEDMFIDNGWEIKKKPEGADLICFTGGSDVSPMLYEAVKIHHTINDLQRDELCANIFHTFVGIIPMVGICRGGQFLNVMCGGELFQHVDGHNVGEPHDAVDPETGQIFEVSSGHHQMMIPSEDGEVLLVAEESTTRLPVSGHANYIPEKDIEAVYYQEEGCVCYQPHPEWVPTDHECQRVFFLMIQEYLS